MNRNSVNKVSLDTDNIVVRRIFALDSESNELPHNHILSVSSNYESLWVNTLDNIKTYGIDLSQELYDLNKRIDDLSAGVLLDPSAGLFVTRTEYNDFASNVTSDISDLIVYVDASLNLVNQRISNIVLDINSSQVSQAELDAEIGGVNIRIDTLSNSVPSLIQFNTLSNSVTSLSNYSTTRILDLSNNKATCNSVALLSNYIYDVSAYSVSIYAYSYATRQDMCNSMRVVDASLNRMNSNINDISGRVNQAINSNTNQVSVADFNTVSNTVDLHTTSISMFCNTLNGYNVKLGFSAGLYNQGSNAIAVGNKAGFVNQKSSSIVLNATGSNLNGDLSNSFFVKPVRPATNANTLYYNSGTGEITYAVAPSGGASLPTTTICGAYVYYNGSAWVAGTDKISLGTNAGLTPQGANAVAIGNLAGNSIQGNYTVAIGSAAGRTSQSANGVAIGNIAGNSNQGASAIAIGSASGQTSQGTNAIAIGNGAGNTNQPNNSIILNATGSSLNATADLSNTFIVKPVRQTANTNTLVYNSSTGEITYETAGRFSNTIIGNTWSNTAYSYPSSAMLNLFNESSANGYVTYLSMKNKNTVNGATYSLLNAELNPANGSYKMIIGGSDISNITSPGYRLFTEGNIQYIQPFLSNVEGSASRIEIAAYNKTAASNGVTLDINRGKYGFNTNSLTETVTVNGTTSLSNTLYIDVAGSASAPAISFRSPADSDTGIYHPGDGQLNIAINGADTMKLSSGNVELSAFLTVPKIILPSTFSASSYLYKIPSQHISTANTSSGWPYSAVTNLSGINVNNSQLAVDILYPNAYWICPVAGLWQVSLNIKTEAQQSQHIVIGNSTKNTPICSAMTTTTTYIDLNDKLLIAGNYRVASVNTLIQGILSLNLIMPYGIPYSISTLPNP